MLFTNQLFFFLLQANEENNHMIIKQNKISLYLTSIVKTRDSAPLHDIQAHVKKNHPIGDDVKYLVNFVSFFTVDENLYLSYNFLKNF